MGRPKGSLNKKGKKPVEKKPVAKVTKKPVAKVTKKPVEKITPVGKTNPTGRVKRTFRKLSEAHSNAIKQGSIKYHKCCRDSNCGTKYNTKK